MQALLFAGVVSFVLSLILTPVMRNAARRWGLVDHPDHGRKLHKDPVARIGGAAILASYVLAFGALQAWSPGTVHFALIWRIAPAVLVVFAIGLIDDIWNIRPWQKFAGQTLAAVLAYWGGVHILFGGKEVPGWVGFLATVFWLVLCTNAVNLIDGMDGLAAGVGLFATTTTLIAALLQNNYDLALLVAPLAGCLLGFLRYNFNPATVFLGDCGSLTIGFFLGCCSVIWSEKSATILGMTAPLLALSVPLLDTGLAVTRRFLRGKPIFGADRAHIHHRLLDRGLTPRRVALLIYGACAIGAALSLLMMNRRFEGLAIVVFCVAAWVGIQQLGYVEFMVAGRILREGAFTRLLNSQVELRALEMRIAAAASPAEFWEVVRRSAGTFGFEAVEMVLAGETFQSGDGDGMGGMGWMVRVPLSEFEYVELNRVREHGDAASFADTLLRTLPPRMSEVRVRTGTGREACPTL